MIQAMAITYIVAEHLRSHDENLSSILFPHELMIASPYLIHRRPDKIPSRKTQASMKTKDHYTQVTGEYISKEWPHLRYELKLYDELEINERPTFHEIRPFSIALRENQGQKAQHLAGHTTRQMIEHYKKGHDVIQWTCVSLAGKE